MKRKRCLILTQSRSGSNYLLDVLNQHSAVLNHGEVFWPTTLYYRVSRVFEFLHIPMALFLNWVLSSRLLLFIKMVRMNIRGNYPTKKMSKIKVVGVKDFFVKFNHHNLFNWLHQNNDIYIIYLYRNNQLERHISLCNTIESGVFVLKNGKNIHSRKLKINIDYMLKRLELFEKQKEVEQREIGKYTGPKIYINYEEYFKNEESIKMYNKRIFEFLGLEDCIVKVTHRRILPKKLEDKVENIEELVCALKNTKFEEFLR